MNADKHRYKASDLYVFIITAEIKAVLSHVSG
jgi:hypothetical protein